MGESNPLTDSEILRGTRLACDMLKMAIARRPTLRAYAKAELQAALGLKELSDEDRKRAEGQRFQMVAGDFVKDLRKRRFA